MRLALRATVVCWALPRERNAVFAAWEARHPRTDSVLRTAEGTRERAARRRKQKTRPLSQALALAPFCATPLTAPPPPPPPPPAARSRRGDASSLRGGSSPPRPSAASSSPRRGVVLRRGPPARPRAPSSSSSLMTSVLRARQAQAQPGRRDRDAVGPRRALHARRVLHRDPPHARLGLFARRAVHGRHPEVRIR